LTDHLDKLCRYFGCRLDQLAEYIPDEEAPGESSSSSAV
jgi:putative transcriptional regulator